MWRLSVIFFFLISPLSAGDPSQNSSTVAVQIFLDPAAPETSYGLMDGETFPVGLGRAGVTKEGLAFRGGSSLLGEFTVSAVLADDRFEMEDALVKQSGKSETWLRENLFLNMSSIDFDGDGQGGEYGAGFIGLKPIDTKAKQPFHFGNYQGVFRWYSYAIHGTQDESRIGKCVTGGCINVGVGSLGALLQRLKVGDRVSISVRK